MRYDLEALENDPWGRGYPPDLSHKGGGVESHYDPRLGREILRMVLAGVSVREIASYDSMPSYATLYQWVKVHYDFRQRWEGAREQLAWERLRQIETREQARVFWQQRKAKMEGKRWWRRGRPSSYTRSKGAAFCRRVARGETLMSITARPDMPSMKVVYTWLKREPDFREAYAKAREAHIKDLEFRAWFIMDQELSACTSRGKLAKARRRTAKARARIGRMRAKVYRAEALD